VVDGGYFHGGIHSVDETAVSGKFKFKVAHYLQSSTLSNRHRRGLSLPLFEDQP
jgi:hypothetical protein